jgi:hypothetical protein
LSFPFLLSDGTKNRKFSIPKFRRAARFFDPKNAPLRDSASHFRLCTPGIREGSTILWRQNRYFSQKNNCLNGRDSENTLSLVYTSGFRMRLPHCVAIFYKLPWFCSTKVSYEKSQRNAENACGNRMCKWGFNMWLFKKATWSLMFKT